MSRHDPAAEPRDYLTALWVWPVTAFALFALIIQGADQAALRVLTWIFAVGLVLGEAGLTIGYIRCYRRNMR